MLFDCTDKKVVRLRKKVEAAVEEKVSRLVKLGPVREAIMVLLRLDSADIPSNVGVVPSAQGGVIAASCRSP